MMGLKMKNTIIQTSVALLLFFGIATSSQATFIPSDKAVGHYTGGWGSSYTRPMARHYNWRQSYSATTGVHGLGRYFAWRMKKGENTHEYEEVAYANGDSHSNGSKPVPEPSIIALFGLGLFGLGLARRRIRK